MRTDSAALQDKLREYLRLEHKLFHTTCKMTAAEFDAACHRYDELRVELQSLLAEETML